MANYYGGGTIIYKGSFASYDPADGNTSSKKSSISTKAEAKKTAQNKSIKTALAPRSVSNKNSKRVLNYIVDQLVSEQKIIILPRRVSKEIKEEIQKFGQAILWAESQKEFKELYSQKVQRKQGRELKNKLAAELKVSNIETLKDEKFSQNEQFKELRIIKQKINTNLKDRRRLIKKLIDQMIANPQNVQIPKNTQNILVEEIESFGSPLKWVKTQPGFEKLHQQLSNKVKTTRKTKLVKSAKTSIKTIRYDSLPLTILKIGKSRALVYENSLSSEELLRFYIRLGTLPQSPKPLKTQKRRSRGKLKDLPTSNVWVSTLNEYQQEAWSKLTTNQKEEYLKNGRVSIGMPKQHKPLSNAPMDYILRQFEANQEQGIDLKKIDWDIT